jgi:hypothetical protein
MGPIDGIPRNNFAALCFSLSANSSRRTIAIEKTKPLKGQHASSDSRKNRRSVSQLAPRGDAYKVLEPPEPPIPLVRNYN